MDAGYRGETASSNSQNIQFGTVQPHA